MTAADGDNEKQSLTEKEKSEQYGNDYLPGLSWVCEPDQLKLYLYHSQT